MPEPGDISEPQISSALPISSTAFMPADSAVQSCLALVCQLERSLRLGQAALLAIEAQRMEQCTAEQARLCRQLKTLLSHPLLRYAILPQNELRSDARQVALDLAPQLVAAATRLQHLARVQAALLRRSQRFLCVLSNWMKGLDSAYGPPRAAGRTLRRGNEIHREF